MNRYVKELHVNSTRKMFFKNPWAFRHALRRRRHCLIAAAIMSVVRNPHLNQPMFQLVDIRYVCMVHFLLSDTPERIANGI